MVAISIDDTQLAPIQASHQNCWRLQIYIYICVCVFRLVTSLSHLLAHVMVASSESKRNETKQNLITTTKQSANKRAQAHSQHK